MLEKTLVVLHKLLYRFGYCGQTNMLRKSATSLTFQTYLLLKKNLWNNNCY